MNIKLIYLTIFFLCSFSTHLRGEDNILSQFSELTKPEVWTERWEEDGFEIYSRKVKGSGLLGFWIKGTLDAPIEVILSILREVETQSKWTPQLTHKSTIREISAIEAVTYSVNDMPWPAWDRDMVLHNKLYLDRERKLLYVLTRSVKETTHPEMSKKKLVRAHLEYGNLGFRPVTDNKTYVEMMLYADPRGSIPKFVVNFFQKKFPIKLLRAIETEAKRAPDRMNPVMKKMLGELRGLLVPTGSSPAPAQALAPDAVVN